MLRRDVVSTFQTSFLSVPSKKKENVLDQRKGRCWVGGWVGGCVFCVYASCMHVMSVVCVCLCVCEREREMYFCACYTHIYM